MDALPMDDEPPCADCTEAEDVDYLNQLANVAAGAGRVAALKRRAESKAGRDICWVASARLAAHGASAAASWWAEAPHSRGSRLNASAMCGIFGLRGPVLWLVSSYVATLFLLRAPARTPCQNFSAIVSKPK